MSEQSSYELLGVTEEASFDEIQTARDRLVDASEEESTKVEQIEAAYDAVLMHRLRLRQEGKIKVPERIRFPERSAPAPKPKEKAAEMTQSLPNWMQDLVDQPSSMDILLPALVTLVLMSIAVFYLTPTVTAGGDGALELVLAAGAASSIYFLNRKEGKFGRAFFITVAGMFAGLILGSLLSIPLENTVLAQPQETGGLVTAATLSVKQFIVVISLAVLWITSSFLR